MAKRPTTSTLTNTASPTYLTQLNQNFTNVRNQFDNTLSLDGSTPNAMNADIDLNGNDLINANSVNTASLRIGGQAVVASDAVNQTVKKEFETVALLLADTGTYTNYAVDDYLRVVDGGFVYKVAASSATNQHVTTAGGVKLYVLPDATGYNVKAFGAVGNGVADDTVAIQSALNVGGSIYFPPGTYMANDLTATLLVHIYGYGATLKRKNSQLASTFILSIVGDKSSVQGLNFDGNAANNVGHTGRHEGLRISANYVTVLDSDSSNTPAGGTRVANCFYVLGNAATLENVTSSNAGYAAIRIAGDMTTVNNARVIDFTEKGIVFDGTVGVSAKSLIISNCRATSASTDINGQACILVDSGSSLTNQLKSLVISNVYCELTGNIAGSNVVKIVNTKHCIVDNFNFVQTGTNYASFRAQERVEYLTLSNGRMDYEFNLDSWDYRQITLQNVTVGKENKSLTSATPISGLYARQQILLTDVSVYGATSGSVQVENWVGQVDSDGVTLTEPNITINGFVQDANAATVPVLFLSMASTAITPGSIVVGDVVVVTGQTNALQTLTGSSTTERLIQRNPGNTFSREFLSASAPAANTWKLSDRVYNTQTTTVGFAGWLCTSAGTPGTWKVFGQAETLTSIAGTPSFVGQVSVVAGEAYIAVGTSSSADWKKITP